MRRAAASIRAPRLDVARETPRPTLLESPPVVPLGLYAMADAEDGEQPGFTPPRRDATGDEQ